MEADCPECGQQVQVERLSDGSLWYARHPGPRTLADWLDSHGATVVRSQPAGSWCRGGGQHVPGSPRPKVTGEALWGDDPDVG